MRDKHDSYAVVEHGPSDACVDLVFFAEGYTKQEEDVFLDDVERLVGEVFNTEGAVFNTYFPIFNIHAVFVESAEHMGVGKEARSAFRLYREKGKLRGILPTRSSYDKVDRICDDVPYDCDFAVILANDEFYGGLGDRIAIISASHTSGALALRHELGHNFADVGEEYDGGGDYSGPNFSETTRICRKGEGPRYNDVGGGVTREVWPCISWVDWLSEKPSKDGRVEPQESAETLLEYPWQSLTEGTPEFDVPFQVQEGGQKGGVEWGYIRIIFSVSGVQDEQHLTVLLDGEELEYRYPGHTDRHFTDILMPRSKDFWAG
jgi:hypothetical protein